MSRPFPPKESPRTLQLPLPTDLTAAQAAAVIELLEQARDAFLHHYQASVMQYWREERVTVTPAPLSDPPF